MTQHSQNGEGVEVLQSDRTFIASVLRLIGGYEIQSSVIESGQHDDGDIVQATARYRQSLAREPATADVGREDRAREVLADRMPLSISSAWDDVTVRSVVRSMLVFSSEEIALSRAAPSSDGGEQTYESDDRRLFCRHCGRAHIRHHYKAGVGFLCAAPSSEPAIAEGERVRNLEAQRQTIEACGRVVDRIRDDYAARVRSTNGEHNEDADAVVVAAKIGRAVRALCPNEALATTPPTTNDAIPAGMAALIEPWKNHHGPLPDFDSPVACVFDSGVQYAVELLAKELGVTDWTPCDGTEEYDGDLGGTMMNIVREAMPLDQDGERMWPSEVCAALSAAPSAPATEAGEEA